jgi:hypothetical protein
VSGILTLPSTEYHAGDDGPPRLSASIAHILCSRSPLHAYTAHPRLNPAYERIEDDRFDIGQVAHAMLLEGRDIVYVIHADNYRKDEAKEAREYGRSMGKVPLLAHQLADCEAMVAAVQEKLAHFDPPLFTDGKPEQTLLWEEADVLFKARFDWLRDDFTAVHDLKTTTRSAHPQAFARRIYDIGGDIQAAMYVRGVEAVTGVRPDFVWCVVETSPPYELSQVAPGADVLALGEAKLERAISTWRACLASGEWPGYDRRIAVAEMPAYEESKWLEREVAA